MPEQADRRGDQVTDAKFTGTFETHLVRLAPKGVNLNAEIATVPLEQVTRMTNAVVLHDGSITSRPGQTSFATAGGQHHSVRRLLDPLGATGTTRVWGIDSGLFLGDSGGLSGVDSGYSGDPLILVPHRPPLSGAPWMYVADMQRMRKVRGDGLVLPIGLPAPSAPLNGTPDIEFRTPVASCNSSDGTGPSGWIPCEAGQDFPPSTVTTPPNPTGAPLVFNDPTAPNGIDGIRMRGVRGSAAYAWDSWIALPFTSPKDLTVLTNVVDSSVTVPATDDDIIHLSLMMGSPQLIEEIRLYFVCNEPFDPHAVPGTGPATADFGTPGNSDAYFKSFRHADFAYYLARGQDQITMAEQARINNLRETDLNDRVIIDTRADMEPIIAVTDPSRMTSFQTLAGTFQWFEFGVLGVPCRRSDFQRIGITPGRDWSTITGLTVYVKFVYQTDAELIELGISDIYLTGGQGPDTTEPGVQPYDARFTNYDPRTGAESNGSPIMGTDSTHPDGDPTTFIDVRRRAIDWVPHPYGDAAIRQRFYRRGGTAPDDWYFLGVNTSDGGSYTDTWSDDAIILAGDIPIDNYQPVPTVDAMGNTVLAQPVGSLWGPVEGMLMACGDQYRPGHLYYSNANEPDHWAATGNVEVCPPSEQLMAGGILGHQAFVFSRQRLYLVYPNLTGNVGVTVAPTPVHRGIPDRWGFCTGPGGIYFAVINDGIYSTLGASEEELSRDIRPLFRGESVNGYSPVNWGDQDDPRESGAVRLTVWQLSLYVIYLGMDGERHGLKYDLLEARWMFFDFGQEPCGIQGEDEEFLLIGGNSSGTTYSHTGTSDAGAAIPVTVRGPSINGGTRDEKLFGDMIIDGDAQGVSISVQNLMNEETVANPAQTISAAAGRQRFILDAFGQTPQRARSIATELTWSTSGTPPLLYQIGYGVTVQPEITERRVTNWDDLGYADEKWMTGCTLDVDTGNVARSILVERDYNGVRDTITELTVQANGRHKLAFSWPAMSAQMVRLRPNDDCQFWVLYRCDWIYQEEPPRIAAWDIYFENPGWDQYFTGLDLYCNTYGETKQIEVLVDGVVIPDPFTGLPYFSVMTPGRNVVHLTFQAGRGHIFRFHALDTNVGLLYQHRWQIQAEPSEQANWNQNFTDYGTLTDKFLKAVLFECDTFGQDKTVRVEADGNLVEVLTVNTSGRKVVQKALTQEALGRVWRMYPNDANPGRLYSAVPVFDEEPYQLDRWETQEGNYGIPTWFSPLFGYITVRSTQDVTLTLAIQHNQIGGTTTNTYTIPSTNGEKVRTYVPFKATKGVLIKYTVTSAAPFYLYREETIVFLQPWAGPQALETHPFGNDDEDTTRGMTSSVGAAERSGGGTS